MPHREIAFRCCRHSIVSSKFLSIDVAYVERVQFPYATCRPLAHLLAGRDHYCVPQALPPLVLQCNFHINHESVPVTSKVTHSQPLYTASHPQRASRGCLSLQSIVIKRYLLSSAMANIPVSTISARVLSGLMAAFHLEHR